MGSFARSVSYLLRALETFRAQSIEFVSFSELLDTSTPTGKPVFTVLGAVAELERSLIVERVKAGLRNARAKGNASAGRGFMWTTVASASLEVNEWAGKESPPSLASALVQFFGLPNSKGS